MIIFLRNIPALSKHSDIIAFLEPGMKASLFGKKGYIENIKILHLKNTRTKISEFHGLVTIQPDSVATRVIKRLNRKKFLNKFIVVREYHRRDWHNDPRLNHKPLASTIPEKREEDRRRRYVEVVEDISNTFSSNKAFNRRYD